MTEEEIKELYKTHFPGHQQMVRETEEAERYYGNRTDVKELPAKTAQEGDNPLRVADNRISHRWHGLLADQKASYLATYPPLIDLGKKKWNTALAA